MWEQARERVQIDIALCCQMFDGMLRRSEASGLTWNDIAREADSSGQLTVCRSKTDQEGEGKSLRIAAACEAVGLGKGYSGHSSRVGGAQAAATTTIATEGQASSTAQRGLCLACVH